MLIHLKWVWLCELILDSDGDHFLFSPIFERTPLSRDLYCYSLAKISEILAGADILSDANICDIFCMAGRYNKLVQCRRESTHKSSAASSKSKLGDYARRDQHRLGEVGKHQWGQGEISCCGLCRAKTVRRCFHACANILLRQIFCRRQHFVDANFLSAPTFCRREYFVNANILSMIIFCRRQHSVAANILSTPIFCLCLDFKDDYLLNILLWLCLCISWLLLLCLNLLGFDR